MTDGQSNKNGGKFLSPRKVKKEDKRREIALSCKDLIHEIGMKNITVAQVAKVAGIGKGTVYE